jgi:hypothetical protein
MARNRIIYQSEGIYVSKEYNSSASGDHAQLARVQSANYNFNIARQDVNQYGELARIDSIVLETPTVSFDTSYYLTDGRNESALGFYVSTGAQAVAQFPSGHIQDGTGRNFYIVTSNEGTDFNKFTGANTLSGMGGIGIGNAYLTDYSVELAVGSIPTVTVSFEGTNMNAFNFSGSTGNPNSGTCAGIDPISGTSLGTSFQLKNPTPNTGTLNSIASALRPGDVSIDFGSFGTGAMISLLSGTSGIHIQSASMSLPLGRTPIERLGSKFAFARVVDFPVTATLTINGVQTETAGGNLVDLIASNPKNDIIITVKRPGTTENAVRYTFRNAQLDSSSVSSSIGSNKTADLTFSTQIGGINDATNGIQMSGSFTGLGAPFA